MTLNHEWLHDERFDDAIGPNAESHRKKIEVLLRRAGGDPEVAARLPGWSWYGLLLGTGYLFYRKLWGPAVILLTIEVGASLAPPPYSYAIWAAAALAMALWAEAWVLERTHRLVTDSGLTDSALRKAGGASVPIAIFAVVVGAGISALLHLNASAPSQIKPVPSTRKSQNIHPLARTGEINASASFQNDKLAKSDAVTVNFPG